MSGKFRKATIFCISALVIGVAAMAVAVGLTIRADSAVKRNLELMSRLAFEDARENMNKATSALKEAMDIGEDSDGDARRAELLADAIYGISGTRAALMQAGLGDLSNDLFGFLNFCTQTIRASLAGKEGADLSGLINMTEELSTALSEDSPLNALRRIAEDKREMIHGWNAVEDEFDRGFASFNTAPELTADALRAKAESYVGGNAVLKQAGGSSFPPTLVLCGENLYVSVSSARGELLELYFDRPPGKIKLDERECAAIAFDFLHRAGISASFPPVSSARADELCGAYFFRLSEKAGAVDIGVRWDTGRVCYFNSFDYYK